MTSKRLRWAGIELRTKGFVPQAICPKLQKAYLNYTFISGNGLEGLKDAAQLNTLEMNATTVSDENVAIIGQLKNLRNLSLDKTILPIPGFVPCHTLTIFDLALTGTGIGDKAIGCIKQYR